MTSSLSRSNRETRGWAVGVNSHGFGSSSLAPAVLRGVAVAFREEYCVLCSFRGAQVALRALASPAVLLYWALASRRRPPGTTTMQCYKCSCMHRIEFLLMI